MPRIHPQTPKKFFIMYVIKRISDGFYFRSSSMNVKTFWVKDINKAEIFEYCTMTELLFEEEHVVSELGLLHNEDLSKKYEAVEVKETVVETSNKVSLYKPMESFVIHAVAERSIWPINTNIISSILGQDNYKDFKYIIYFSQVLNDRAKLEFGKEIKSGELISAYRSLAAKDYDLACRVLSVFSHSRTIFLNIDGLFDQSFGSYVKQFNKDKFDRFWWRDDQKEINFFLEHLDII